MTHTFTTDTSAAEVCLDFASSATSFDFDISCDETNIAAVLGTNAETDVVLTWTAVVSSPYETSINTIAKTATLTIKNPCADASFAAIEGADLTAKTYIITSPE